jgi:hypothetical protein
MVVLTVADRAVLRAGLMGISKGPDDGLSTDVTNRRADPMAERLKAYGTWLVGCARG